MRMYQEELMDHFQHPRHRGVLEHPDFDTGHYNPSCGDLVSIQGKVTDTIVTAIAFQGKGCVISQAAASMLCEYALHKSVAELMQLKSDDIIKMVKIPLGPTRLKCALLALDALKDGIKEYQKGK